MKRRIAWLLAACLALAACAAPAEPEGGEEGALIYYLVPEEEARGSDRIRAVRTPLGLPEDADSQEAAQAVVERLLAGPLSGELESPLPEGVELLHLELRDQIAHVDVSARSCGNCQGCRWLWRTTA